MQNLVDVQINCIGDTESYLTQGMKLNTGDEVIVEADRGLDNGVVCTMPREVPEEDVRSKAYRKVIRKVNPWDKKQIIRNREKRVDLLKICSGKIADHALPMKLVNAEYAFDRSKIVFYFTADKRVDFRKLVKDLASIFRVRIELRQIGVRDEARMLGGCGPCGRQLCCGAFLEGFAPVTIKMAKLQNLSLNPAKISGCCGRLMCCLGYENEVYRKSLKLLPRPGKRIRTADGIGRVISVKPLKERIVVELENNRRREIGLEEVKEV